MASIIKVDQIQESTTGVGTNFSNTGSATTPTISIGNQTNKGFYHLGTDRIGVSVSGQRVGEIGSGYGGFTGNIIQVQQTVKSDTFTTTSTTYVDITGFSCSITPKYNTSKILLLIDIGAFTCIGGGSSIMRLLRDSTEIYSGNGSEGVLNQIHDGGPSSGEHYFGSFHHGSSYLDSPSTISQITYKIQIKSAGAYTSVFNRNAYDTGSVYGGRTASSIILMEVQQ